jgi:hypothetical protein
MKLQISPSDEEKRTIFRTHDKGDNIQRDETYSHVCRNFEIILALNIIIFNFHDIILQYSRCDSHKEITKSNKFSFGLKQVEAS